MVRVKQAKLEADNLSIGYFLWIIVSPRLGLFSVPNVITVGDEYTK